MITGFVAVFAFHKCQTRDYSILSYEILLVNYKKYLSILSLPSAKMFHVKQWIWFIFSVQNVSRETFLNFQRGCLEGIPAFLGYFSGVSFIFLI